MVQTTNDPPARAEDDQPNLRDGVVHALSNTHRKLVGRPEAIKGRQGPDIFCRSRGATRDAV